MKTIKLRVNMDKNANVVRVSDLKVGDVIDSTPVRVVVEVCDDEKTVFVAVPGETKRLFFKFDEKVVVKQEEGA
jgi:hypothetical protein